jgi:hypothetical protein
MRPSVAVFLAKPEDEKERGPIKLHYMPPDAIYMEPSIRKQHKVLTTHQIAARFSHL